MIGPFLTDQDLVAEHKAWLAPFGAEHLTHWMHLLNTDVEGAMCEAGFRRLLEQNRCSVQPNELVNGKGRKPDFFCESSSGRFYFEATSVRIKTIKDRFSLPEDEVSGKNLRVVQHSPSGPKMTAFEDQPITELFFEKCIEKTTQCSGLDAPCVVGIGTFHRPAAWVSLETDYVDELLVGRHEFRIALDSATGGLVDTPKIIASLNHSFALRYKTPMNIVEQARKSISAVVLAYPNRSTFDRFIGVIHPDAARPFDWRLLPNVQFRALRINRAEGYCEPHWANEESE